ncbi:MAG: DMT family transporter [Prevotellaceae bacterium]|jgi:drug/metabolite transporter (DMT)-like permease|nr:DMT family transporter [Prevotellaceae bacterium]
MNNFKRFEGDRNLKAHVALLTAYIIFGLNTPIIKEIFMDGRIAPLAVMFYRIAGAAALFWLASLFTRRERVAAKDFLMLFAASMFGIIGNQAAFVEGLARTSPIDASVITTTAPIMTMLLAALFIREPITWKKAGGVLLGMAGALALIMHESSDRNAASLEGNLLCLASVLSFVVYLTAFKPLIRRYSAVTLMKWMFLFALPVGFFMSSDAVTAVDYSALPLSIHLHVAYVVILASFVSYLFIPVGQKYLRPTIVSMYNYIQPLMSSLLAVILGIDTFGPVKAFATLLIFVGVYFVIQSKSRAQMEADRNYKL